VPRDLASPPTCGWEKLEASHRAARAGLGALWRASGRGHRQRRRRRQLQRRVQLGRAVRRRLFIQLQWQRLVGGARHLVLAVPAIGVQAVKWPGSAADSGAPHSPQHGATLRFDRACSHGVGGERAAQRRRRPAVPERQAPPRVPRPLLQPLLRQRAVVYHYLFQAALLDGDNADPVSTQKCRDYDRKEKYCRDFVDQADGGGLLWTLNDGGGPIWILAGCVAGGVGAWVLLGSHGGGDTITGILAGSALISLGMLGVLMGALSVLGVWFA